MSENAKKKRSRKQSPEELLNEAVANHESSFESWQSYREFGGQDPFWADGCNMNLIRNHIIYYKRQISELCEQNGLEIPKCMERELPPQMDVDYMAQPDKIREGAKEAFEKMNHRRHDHLQRHRAESVSGAGGLSRCSDTQKEVLLDKMQSKFCCLQAEILI